MRLIYLTITRPELGYVVHVMSQFMQATQTNHLNATRFVLCYIKGNQDLVFYSMLILTYKCMPTVIVIGVPTHLRDGL